MKYLPINNSLFKFNRSQFSKKLIPGSLAVFNSNDILPTNADGSFPLKQNSNLFYLSGINQEESILIIFPDHPDPKFKEVLFLRETNEQIAVWEGHKYSKEEASGVSGINTILWLDQFNAVFNAMMAEAENIYLHSNEHIRRSDIEIETNEMRFIKWCKSKYPLHKYHRSAPVIYELRCIKSELEIELLQKAIDITEKGFRRILKFVKPGVKEYEIEAEFIHEFIKNRSAGFAYSPIIATGANACVLHYIENNSTCMDGDVLLLDVGAEYANYNADMTRSIPVNGKFTKRQKDVYNAVLKVQKEAFKMLKVGNVIPEYQKEISRVMELELIGLGLIDKTDVKNQDPEKPLFKKYFMHGVSHHLGLDVHDVASVYKQMEKGMVFTVEPGIYIREEGLGIRLEDNVVLTEKGINNIMKNIPISAEEIEDLMN